jgi:hypothetical protein
MPVGGTVTGIREAGWEARYLPCIARLNWQRSLRVFFPPRAAASP